MNQTKITVKIFEPLLKGFDHQIDRLFIKRDAFLNHIIKAEVAHLAEEMAGKRLSSKARQYVSQQLKKMGTKTVNVVVDKDTANALNAVVGQCNMVRDAFLNRLIIFLRSSAPLLSHLELPHFIVRSEFDSVYEEMPTSPLGSMEAVTADPFYYLRISVAERYNTGLYLLDLPKKLIGFSCFIDDSQVPGTREYAESMMRSDELLKELGSFELDAFAVAPSTVENNAMPCK